MKKRDTKGLTAIQLLIVLTTFGIIISWLLVMFKPWVYLETMRDEARKRDLVVLQQTIDLYYQKIGKYPSSSGIDAQRNGASISFRLQDVNNHPVAWGESFVPFLSHLPRDPSNTQKYVYFSPDGQVYYIYASLESEGAEELCNGGKACYSLTKYHIPPNACGDTCNYAVSSPNVNP